MAHVCRCLWEGKGKGKQGFERGRGGEGEVQGKGDLRSGNCLTGNSLNSREIGETFAAGIVLIRRGREKDRCWVASFAGERALLVMIHG